MNVLRRDFNDAIFNGKRADNILILVVTCGNSSRHTINPAVAVFECLRGLVAKAYC